MARRNPSKMPRFVAIPAAALVIVSGVASGLGLRAPQVEAWCDPIRGNENGNWAAGWSNDLGQTVYWVKSLITEYDPFVDAAYQGVPSVSTAWVMLSRTGAIPQKYAQVGWWEIRNPGESVGTRKLVAQWTYDGGYYTSQYPWNPQIGTWTQYKVFWVSAVNRMLFYYNDSFLPDMPRPNFVPNRTNIAGEITNRSNQLPGATNAHEQMPVAMYYTDQQHYYDGDPPYASLPDFATWVVSIWQLDIWDKECAY